MIVSVMKNQGQAIIISASFFAASLVSPTLNLVVVVI